QEITRVLLQLFPSRRRTCGQIEIHMSWNPRLAFFLCKIWDVYFFPEGIFRLMRHVYATGLALSKRVWDRRVISYIVYFLERKVTCSTQGSTSGAYKKR